MKEYCNIINIYPISKVAHINNNTVILKQNEKPIVAIASKFHPEVSINNSKSSLLSTISESVYIDKLSPEDANVLKIKRSVILQFSDSSGKEHIIGSLQYPAKIIYIPNLNTGILKIEHKQPAYI